MSDVVEANDFDQVLRLGTRGSKLARWQANYVAAELEKLGRRVEIIEIRTQGDRQQVGPIEAIGSVGVFTKELQRELLAERIDFAVHSLKDLPTTSVEGLTLAASPERAPISDALISNTATSISDLPEGACVGTGSFRRKAQLLNRRPDLVVEDLRGNVETRLRKLDDGEYDAILLAQAGLARLGLEDRITQVIPPSELLPAPGQGALGIECRADDAFTRKALVALNHLETRAAVTAERSALSRLEGGCLAALGAWARVEANQLCLNVVVLSEDGSQRLDESAVGEIGQAEQLGVSVADNLLARGAAELLIRRQG